MANAERFRHKPTPATAQWPVYGSAEVDDCQRADAATRDARTAHAFEQKRKFQAREARVIGRRESERGRLGEAKLDALFNQRLRYEEAAIEPQPNFATV